MQLSDALIAVARQLKMDPKLLNLHATEDTLKGFYDGGGEYTIPYAADGRFLYALIRYLKPRNVLEIGTARGGSARHIVEALEMNGKGHLITLDIDQNSTIADIPLHLQPRLSHIKQDAEFWLKDLITIPDRPHFDFIHEDGSHSTHLVHAIYDLLPQLMPKGGVVVSHDTALGVGADIVQGIKNAGFPEPPCYSYQESPCGFSVMKYDGNKP